MIYGRWEVRIGKLEDLDEMAVLILESLKSKISEEATEYDAGKDLYLKVSVGEYHRYARACGVEEDHGPCEVCGRDDKDKKLLDALRGRLRP